MPVKKEPKTPFSSVMAALLLATLVLAVFGFAQNSGPESAVVRFHQAVAVGNPTRVQAMIPSYPEERESVSVVRAVQHLLGSGYGYQVVDVQQRGKQAIVWVDYGSSAQRFYVLAFVLEMRGNQWIIDGAESYRLNTGTNIRL